MHKNYVFVLSLALILTFVVITLGAYVRLSHAGLGCPDWPGCYGHLVGVPDSHTELAQANQNFDRPVEIGKAWKEMVHRYFAGALGLLVLLILFLSIRAVGFTVLPVVLLGVIIFQALLGMWTVTLQLKPVVVMAHLLGGFTTFAIIWWLWLRERFDSGQQYAHKATSIGMIALVLLIGQIALGGWTSANYAALACPDLPYCQGQLWPPTDFENAFILWRGLGVDYEFGVLDSPARTAIHLTHRMGAIVAVLGIAWFLASIYRGSAALTAPVRFFSRAIMLFLTLQVVLGLSNVAFHLPLPVAVLHNGVAALLLLSILGAIYVLRCAPNREAS